MNMRINWEALGIAASVACAIHCAVVPLFITSLPLFGVNIIHNVFLEVLLLGTAFVIGFSTLWHGYKKHHHSFKPIILFSIGIGLMLSRMLFRDLDLILLFPAAFFIIIAHVNNHKSCRVHNHAHEDDCDH